MRAKKLYYGGNKKKQLLQKVVKGIQARQHHRPKRSAKFGESRNLWYGKRYNIIMRKQRRKQSQQLKYYELIPVIFSPKLPQETTSKDKTTVEESGLTEINRCQQLLSEVSISN